MSPRPQPDAGRAESVTPHEVRIAGPNGWVLSGSLYLPVREGTQGTNTPGLLVGHGAGSNRRRHDSFCRQACGAGLAVLSFDFRGHGGSGGELDGPAEEDVLAAADFLRGHPLVDGKRLGYRGSSMGGYYGLRAAVNGGFIALALLCPATEQVLTGALGDARGHVERREEGLSLRFDADALRTYFSGNDIYADATRVSCPVLLVHARGDSVVPLECSLQLASRLAGPTELIILPDGGHSSAQGSPQIHEQVATWLATRLYGRTGG